jgi:hypothetical protein
LKNYSAGRAHTLVARFRLTARDGRPVPHAAPVPDGCGHCAESARCRWPPVAIAHIGWPLLSTVLDVTEQAVAHSAFSPPPFSRTPRCSTLLRPLLHPPLRIIDELPCHTPVLGKRTEASIRVPKMFNSHVRPTIW